MRINHVYKSVNRPLTLLGVERRLFFFAAINGVEEGVKDALQLVELYDRRGSVVSTLSGGMRQRCSLAWS